MDVDNSNPNSNDRKSAPLDSNGHLTAVASNDVREMVKNQKTN